MPNPAVMKTAVASCSTSAVCQVPGALTAYWPGPKVTVERAPSGSSWWRIIDPDVHRTTSLPCGCISHISHDTLNVCMLTRRPSAPSEACRLTYSSYQTMLPVNNGSTSAVAPRPREALGNKATSVAWAAQMFGSSVLGAFQWRFGWISSFVAHLSSHLGSIHAPIVTPLLRSCSA